MPRVWVTAKSLKKSYTMETNFWETYTSIFPDRYLKDSPIDGRIADWIDNRERTNTPAARCLDVGGGTKGTAALKMGATADNPTTHVWSLDPNVTPPNWAEPLSWANTPEGYFDLIVAKNSINYLTIQEIKALTKMLTAGGTLLCNSFQKPSEIHRPFQNSESGTYGMEHTSYNTATGKIDHRLEITGPTPRVITHCFYFYPEEAFRKALTPGKLEINAYNINSVLYKFEKN